MDWHHAFALGLLLALATCWRWRGPVLCRLGVHARPPLSSTSRWVCRRCPATQGMHLPADSRSHS